MQGNCHGVRDGCIEVCLRLDRPRKLAFNQRNPCACIVMAAVADDDDDGDAANEAAAVDPDDADFEAQARLTTSPWIMVHPGLTGCER